MKLAFKSLVAATALAFAGQAQAASCGGVTFGGNFASYSCDSLGTPTGVTGLLGGIEFLNNNTLLVGGNANNIGGYIAQIGVTRGVGNHITGFSGPSSTFASAPYIDGGLTYGPGGVLFATGYPVNTLLQFKPGSSAPDRTDSLAGNLNSVGSLVFVPTGFAGAGGLKILSYNQGNIVDAMLTADGLGTYNVSTGPTVATIPGGLEGAVYVSGINPGFGGFNSMLIAEYGFGKVGAYQIDGSGNPILGSRMDFLNGLSGAEGALIDPLTGDFLFSTFGGGNQVFVIQGFAAPPGGVPEPASWALMIAGFGLAGVAMRRRRETVRVTYA